MGFLARRAMAVSQKTDLFDGPNIMMPTPRELAELRTRFKLEEKMFSKKRHWANFIDVEDSDDDAKHDDAKNDDAKNDKLVVDLWRAQDPVSPVGPTPRKASKSSQASRSSPRKQKKAPMRRKVACSVGAWLPKLKKSRVCKGSAM